MKTNKILLLVAVVGLVYLFFAPERLLRWMRG